jgi:16S rRNA processing protein RimM
MAPKSYRAAKSHFIVVPETPLQKEEWDGLKGTLLHVPRDALPAVSAEEYYITDLVGLDAFAGGETRIGKVKSVQDFGAGDIVEIALASGGSVMVPFRREDVPTVDLEAGRIVVATLDLWTVDPSEKRPPDAK